jgi:hypothetical protein
VEHGFMVFTIFRGIRGNIDVAQRVVLIIVGTLH